MISLREHFGKTLCELAKRYDFYVIDCDVASGTGTYHFREAYPERFIQAGISEQSATGLAAGLASIASWLVDEKGIAVDRILVLLRSDANHKFSEPIRKALENEGLAVATVENPFVVLDSSEGRELLSMLRLMSNSEDSLILCKKGV